MQSDAKAAAQADYERRIRAALVEVPVEPDQRLYDGTKPMADGGDTPMTAAEEVLAWLLVEKIGVPDDVPYSPDQAQEIIVRQLSSPPHREGEDSAEAIEKEIASVVQSVNEWDDRTSPDDYPEHLLITSEELADILRNFSAALAATRSGSATSSNGGEHG